MKRDYTWLWRRTYMTYGVPVAMACGVLGLCLAGCGGTSTSSANRSEFSVIRIYDPATQSLSEPMNKAYLYHGEWSPDGTKIVTDTAGASTQIRYLSDIRMVDVAAGTVTSITDTPDEDEHSPQFSPDGTKLVYVANTQLVIRTLSNNAVTTLNVTGFVPRWSPDGQSIAYEGNGIRRHDTAVTDTALTTGHRPTWITNTQLLIARTGTDNRRFLYTYTIGGSAMLVGEGTDGDVASDQSYVLYAYLGDIYRSTLPGLLRTLLIANASNPRLSPDRTLLAFVRNGTVYTAPMANLSAQTAIAEGANLRWSQQGKLLFEARVYR